MGTKIDLCRAFDKAESKKVEVLCFPVTMRDVSNQLSKTDYS